MPDIFIVLILVASCLLSVGFLLTTLLEDMDWWKAFIPSLLITILVGTLFGFAVNSPRIYTQIVEGQVNRSIVNGQIYTTISYLDERNMPRTLNAGYILPDSRVKIHLPQRMYYGIRFFDNPYIEVLNDEVQSRQYEAETISDGKRPQGLLSE